MLKSSRFLVLGVGVWVFIGCARSWLTSSSGCFFFFFFFFLISFFGVGKRVYSWHAGAFEG